MKGCPAIEVGRQKISLREELSNGLVVASITRFMEKSS